MQLGLTELSPLNPAPKDTLFVAFKSYFDGGNQADSEQYEIVTLAAFSGEQIQWKNFERQWNAILSKHGANCLHTTDAVAMSGQFSKRNGWTAKKINDFINDCAGVIERCSARTRGRSLTVLGVRGHAISVILADYKRALKNLPELWEVPHICAVQCVNCSFHFARLLGVGAGYQLFFDRNEPFCGHIRDRTANKSSRRNTEGWKLVTSITEADMEKVPALQAADLLAWCVNHQYEEGRPNRSWQERVLAIDRDSGWYDYDRLCRPDREIIRMVNSWKLPRRKPMR
jgi:hypothetical protein